MIPRLELPASRWILALVALAFLLPGLTGHEPWKTYDAVAIEIISQMQRTGDWLVPRIAGEPWIEDPPLYHWVGLLFASLLGWALPLHGAVRLASAMFVLVALWLIHHAAGRAAASGQEQSAGATAAMVLLGSSGLFVHAHEAVPDLATLAAMCAALAFATHFANRAPVAGFGIGMSLGAGFLATGPVAPAAMGLAILAGALVCGEWRNRRVVVSLGVATAVATLVAATWTLALAWRAPAQSAEWWSVALQSRGELVENLRYYAVTASWFTWPAWPLAAWALWAARRQITSPAVFVPLAALVLSFAGISIAGPAQDINTIALLPPLAMLAAQGMPHLRRGAESALDWFGVMTFTLFAGLVWLGYVAMTWGLPPRIARNFAKSAPGFEGQFEWWPFAIALGLTLAWAYVALFTPPSPTRGVMRWAAGVALLWGTLAMLWFPWADYQKSYAGVARQIQSRIPAGTRCVARIGVGSAQRAALSYHAGIRTQPFDRAKPSSCPLLLVQGSARHERDAPGAAWVKLADVGRPGDKAERLRLYRHRP